MSSSASRTTQTATRQLVTGIDRPTVKQLPTVVFFVAIVVACAVFPSVFVRSQTAILIATGILAVATVFALLFPRDGRWAHLAYLIPLADFLAIGILRLGAGTPQGSFDALILLPLVWLAAEYGRRNAVMAASGAIVAVAIPLAFDWSLWEQPFFLTRSVIAAGVFAVSAVLVNLLARKIYKRERAAQRLAREREQALDDSLRNTAKLAESEARLREMERMFMGVWEAVSEQVVVGTDTSGLVDAWNPGATRLLGYTEREALGQLFVDQLHDRAELENRSRELGFPAGETVLNPGFSALVEQARNGTADVRDWTYIAFDGSRIPVSVSVTARVDEAGEIIGYLFVAGDVTGAQEIARLKDEFLGLVSHELRTPLSSILGYLELLRDDARDELSEEQLNYLSVAERNAQRLLKLVSDLLFAAQVDAGGFPITLRPMSLTEVVEASIESAQPAAASAGVEIVTSIAPGVTINGDALRLGQACDNLINNAIKFSPKGGTVTVSLSTSASRATVDVLDTGVGIAAAELDKLFSRFFRTTAAIQNAVPGIGLGLVISKSIVTAHHGDMGVESAEGRGAKFWFTVPTAREAATGQISLPRPPRD
ncbi:MAG: PAS domain-containing protein [Cryobacterium sp.]|nr:PAS domain-containing protein [Cryobacterium sp.]